MTTDEYRQLVEFLTGKFGEVETGFAQVGTHFAQVDARFAQVDARFSQVGTHFAQVDARFAQIDAQFVLVHRELADVRQSLRAEIQQLSDTVDGTLAHFRLEVRAEFEEVKGLIRLSYGDLDRRVRRLEEHG